MNNKFIFVLQISLTFLLFGITSANASTATENCRAVKGHIQEFQTNDDDEALATRGRVTGNLVGIYKFELGPTAATSDGSLVLFFEGTSSITTREGKLKLKELGALDTERPGNFSVLATITGGTEGFNRAHGQIHTFGNFDLTLGIGNFKYKGVVCVPI